MEAPILATHDLGLDIGGARIVADVSLEVGEGELVGIIGPNGAGKTTLFNLLSGLYRPTAGQIELRGRATHDATIAASRRAPTRPRAAHSRAPSAAGRRSRPGTSARAPLPRGGTARRA